VKIYNGLNGIFYVLFGLYGALLPYNMSKFLGFDLSLLGTHELRSIFMAMAGLGLISLLYVKKLTDQKPLTLAIIFVTLSFAAGRLLGLVLDGAGPILTYQELGLEAIWVAIGTFLYKRS